MIYHWYQWYHWQQKNVQGFLVTIGKMVLMVPLVDLQILPLEKPRTWPLCYYSSTSFATRTFSMVVVVCRLHYINTLKQELDGTRAYLETDTDEVSVVNAHLNDLPVQFSVCVNEGQDKLPTMMYWLPKLHKRPYKARFIANSSPCTTTELSKLLTSCLTAIKSHAIRYCETVYETSNKNWFWSIKNSGEVLSKLKCRGFRATSLSTYDFSTLYTTLPHNLIKEKLLDLIEWIKRALKTMVLFIWHVMTERLFSLPLTKVGIHFGHARMCATPC